jgi:arylsulfatase A-like enzyme
VDLDGPRGRQNLYGTVEALFFALPEDETDPVRALREPKARRRAAIPAVPAVRGPERLGSTPWSTHTLSFSPPPSSNWMLVSLDHSRQQDERPLAKGTSGQVWFDDVTVTREAQAPALRLRDPDPGPGGPHPLRLRVEVPNGSGGTDVRDAIYAPAPSALSFQRRIPPGAMLTLAPGLLPHGEAPHGAVRFEVRIRDAAGGLRSAATWTLRPLAGRARPGGRRGKGGPAGGDEPWIERRVDLSAWAGQEVQIELVTEAAPALDPEESAPAAAGPATAALAAWGDPVLSASAPSRLVVLVVLDAVAARHLGPWGSARPTAPALERIAQGGVLFERASAAAPWTLPSVASLLTGLDVVQHGAGESSPAHPVGRRPLSPAALTLPELLRDVGFRTAGIADNPYLTRAFGMDQGFSLLRGYGRVGRSPTAASGVDAALSWLDEHPQGDRLLMLHLMDAHGPYRAPRSLLRSFVPEGSAGRWAEGLDMKGHAELASGRERIEPEEERQRLRDLYDGALLWVDSEIGRLRDGLAERIGTGELTFLVVADHGEEFWEHGGFEHGHQLHEELLHVPLLLENALRLPEGLRVARAVRTVDILPTLCELLGMPPPPGIDGRSLLPLLGRDGAAQRARGRPYPGDDAESGPADDPLDTALASATRYGPERMALRVGSLKYLYRMKNPVSQTRRHLPGGRHQLFDLSRDPGEGRDLAGERPGDLLRLHAELERRYAPALRGRAVLVLDGGGAERTFAGRLELPAGNTWATDWLDLVAPRADGTAGTLRVRLDGRLASFELRAERALLALRPSRAVADEDLRAASVTVDGENWDGRMERGPLPAPSPGAVLLPARHPDKPRVWLALLPPREPPGSAPAPQAPGRAQLEEMRSLGYVE